MDSEENIKIKNVWISKNITIYQSPQNNIQKSIILTSKNENKRTEEEKMKSVNNYDSNGLKTPISQLYNKLASNGSLNNLQMREAGDLFVISSQNALSKTGKNPRERFTKSSMARRNTRHLNNTKLPHRKYEEAKVCFDNYQQSDSK